MISTVFIVAFVLLNASLLLKIHNFEHSSNRTNCQTEGSTAKQRPLGACLLAGQLGFLTFIFQHSTTEYTYLLLYKVAILMEVVGFHTLLHANCARKLSVYYVLTYHSKSKHTDFGVQLLLIGQHISALPPTGGMSDTLQDKKSNIYEISFVEITDI